MIFDPAPALALYLLAAAGGCQQAGVPAVDIVFNNTPPVITNNMSAEQLGAFEAHTKVSHKAGEVFTTGGLTEAPVKAGFAVGFRHAGTEGAPQTCLWVEKIEVNVDYAPTIHIADMFKQGSCNYRETWQHEMRHVNTDIITLQEYLPRLKAHVAAAAKMAAQPRMIAPELLPQTENGITQSLQQTLNMALDELDRLRLQRQQTVDTRQEYLRLSRACPHEKRTP